MTERILVATAPAVLTTGAANTVLTVSAATDIAAGSVELATAAEATTGADTTRAVTAAGVKAVVDAHVASADPHPTYLTAAEGNAAYQLLDADLTDIAAIADAQGDIIVRGAAGWERLAKSATSTDVLTAGASQPAWAAATGGSSSSLPHYSKSRTDLHSGATFRYGPLTTNGTTGAAAGSFAQRPFWWPFIADRTLTIATINCYCWTLEAGSTLRLGIYNCTDEWVPTTLVADYGTVSGAATGLKTATGTSTVPAGPFVICVWPSNHAAVRWSVASSHNASGSKPLGHPLEGSTHGAWRLQTETADYSAGLPSPITATSLYMMSVTAVCPDITVSY